jgi:signal transduction histidine kinase
MDDMLQLARMQARRVDFNPELLDLDALCREIIDEFSSQPDVLHPISYSCDNPGQLSWLDMKLMRQAISNLVSNAMKYSPMDKPVILQLKYTPETLVFSISDQGIGISETDQQHLFEPFHRGGNVGAISGTGLGLVITKESVDLHGGTISVESQVGLGTTFTVQIPTAIKQGNNNVQNPRN